VVEALTFVMNATPNQSVATSAAGSSVLPAGAIQLAGGSAKPLALPLTASFAERCSPKGPDGHPGFRLDLLNLDADKLAAGLAQQ